MNRRSLTFLGACILALNCRSALGIEELEPSAGDTTGSAGSSVSGAQGAKGASGGGGSGVDGSGGGVGKGLAGSGGAKGEAESPGGPKGAAGAGAGGTGGEAGQGAGGAGTGGGGGTGGKGGGGGTGGTGGTGGAPGSPDECQRACVNATPPAAVGEYFDAFAGCACGDDLLSCQPLCGLCDIDAGNFDDQSASCIECVSLNAISTACSEADGCGSDCELLRECLAECSE